MPYRQSNALVADGVFGWSRNPMYLGMVRIVAGIAVLVRVRAIRWYNVVHAQKRV